MGSIESLQVLVRPARVTDANEIQSIYAPVVQNSAISFEYEPPSREEMAARIETTLPSYPYLVAEADGRVVGYAYSSSHAARAAYRWSVNASAYVDPRHHRRGVGRSLYAAMLHILRRQGFHSAFAGIALPNEKSIGLHEAMGFRHLGVYREVGFKLGAWHDVGWWRLGLAEGPPGPDPIPFEAILGDVEGLIREGISSARAARRPGPVEA
jgi:phosphinothricin acetyltransferase